MRASAVVLAALACGSCLGLAACGDDSSDEPPLASGVVLTEEEKEVWAELPPDRSAIPALLYHGIGPESNFSDAEDAEYGVGTEDFAKQLSLMAHAGYETIELQTFLDFVAGKPVDLPPRPLLITFDDARSDSFAGADSVLRDLDYNAVMFVDVGRVDEGHPEYLGWDELEGWKTAGAGSRTCTPAGATRGSSTARSPTTPARSTPTGSRARTSPAGASAHARTSSSASRRSPTTSGPTGRSPSPRRSAATARTAPTTHVSPTDLLGWLTGRYEAVFTQDVNARAKPGAGQPLGRIQVTRATTGGSLRQMLLSGEP